MMKSLRKRHLRAWIILSILLPVILIASWWAIPQAVTSELLQPQPGAPLPVTLRTVERDQFSVLLHANADTSQWQLEWRNKGTLTYPTATIYRLRQGSDSIGDAQLLGRIESRGNYYFILTSDSGKGYRFIVYDFIHEQIIDTVSL